MLGTQCLIGSRPGWSEFLPPPRHRVSGDGGPTHRLQPRLYRSRNRTDINEADTLDVKTYKTEKRCSRRDGSVFIPQDPGKREGFSYKTMLLDGAMFFLPISATEDTSRVGKQIFFAFSTINTNCWTTGRRSTTFTVAASSYRAWRSSGVSSLRRRVEEGSHSSTTAEGHCGTWLGLA